jgi:tRNA nucleotidyltransferase/poly(A) polymerase
MELIRNNISLIKHIPLDYIGKVLYKILSYKHSYKALSVMQEFGIFNVCFDDIPLSKCLNDSDLECLRVFEGNTNMQNEIISEIFDSNSISELNRLEIFDEESLNQIKWLINHKDMYQDRNDFEWRQVICDSISEGMDIHYIKDLVLKNNKRQYLLHHDDNTKQQCEQLFFNLCARPYFIEQLDISDEDILKIDSNANVMAIKKMLLNKLIFSKKYPDKKEINNMLIQCIKEGIA